MSSVFLVLAKLWATPAIRKAIIVGVLVVTTALTMLTLYRTGLRRGADRMHAADVEHERAAVAAADAKYRAQEVTYAKQIDQLRVEYAKTETTAQVVDSATVRALDAGARRVRLPVVRCGPNPAAAGPTTARADDSASAELPGPVAAALYAIAADGDQAIRQLTALQAWARSAVTLCNGGSK
jgi:hypothetical protein